MLVKMPLKQEDAKMKELLLYVAQECEKDENFGAVKLNKILFYADFLSYLKRGKSITGQEYFALDEGPAPKRLLPLRKELQDEEKIAIKRVDRFGLPRPQERVVVLKPVTSFRNLSADDLTIASSIIKMLWSMTGRQASDMSHQFKGWKSAYSKGERTKIPIASVVFDAEGFLGVEIPPLPKHLIDFGKRLDAKFRLN
jgi:hypothetical protein